jgi:hypothetical protein
MKTTENLITSNDIKDTEVLLKSKLKASITPLHARSLRPAKSMVRLRSLKPKRIDVGTTLRRKPIKA